MQTRLKVLFVLIIITLTLPLSVNAQTESNKFIVVLDAGHGGKDPGKPSKYGYTEKEIALKVVLAVGKELEKNKDIEVVYTRKTDVLIDLFQRGKIANKANADLFVSIHCNAHTSQAYGSETYVLGVHRNKTNFDVAKAENEVIFLEEDYEHNYNGFDPNSPESFIGLTLMQEQYLDQSIQLASLIQQNFTSKLKRKNRGVKQAGFIVLHQTVMPSVLVETGFITNTSEGKYLNSKKGQGELSVAIAKAIESYKKSVDQNFVATEYITEEETIIPSEEKIIPNTIFKVQIAAASKKLEPKSYNFKGLKELSRDKEGKLYKYFYGYTSDINKIQQMQKVAKQKGFKSAFIVAYRDGERISLEKALNSGTK
ncbi:N-acetylmuramoyl-L-alanine amidase family protein [Lacinutrix mariniflava]|uniref:N-acetylmuramoyl-L-alanine amidase family protein n=1 Tax=Lacinutrix mariniflava TaxID=342955 RepID=UPI0006E2CCD2|nr:N-acetylmuramoyl-L-alanine amidase [Lacinutrix mariniflava]